MKRPVYRDQLPDLCMKHILFKIVVFEDTSITSPLFSFILSWLHLIHLAVPLSLCIQLYE